MKVELSSDETSLIVGMIAIWKRIANPSDHEKEIALNIANKIFAEDKKAADKVFEELGKKDE